MEVVIVKEGAIKVSEKDIKIIEYFSKGWKSDDIAAELSMNNRTLEAHVFKLRGAFHASNITQLACEFLRQGLIK